jgi:hypothetical protein
MAGRRLRTTLLKADLRVHVRDRRHSGIFDTSFYLVLRLEKKLPGKVGLSVSAVEFGSHVILAALGVQFFLMADELRQAQNTVILRSDYWLRCLKVMTEDSFRVKSPTSPQPSLTFGTSPYRRNQVKANRTRLELQTVSVHDEGKTRCCKGECKRGIERERGGRTAVTIVITR